MINRNIGGGEVIMSGDRVGGVGWFLCIEKSCVRRKNW